MTLEVSTTCNVIPENKVLGTKEKKVHYMVLDNGKEKVVINIGDGTVEKINKLLKK